MAFIRSYSRANILFTISGHGESSKPDGEVDIPDALKSKPLRDVLSDAGTFAYVSVCAISLSVLYEDRWHR